MTHYRPRHSPDKQHILPPLTSPIASSPDPPIVGLGTESLDSSRSITSELESLVKQIPQKLQVSVSPVSSPQFTSTSLHVHSRSPPFSAPTNAFTPPSRPASRVGPSVITQAVSPSHSDALRQLLEPQSDAEMLNQAISEYRRRHADDKRPSTSSTIRTLLSSSHARRRAVDKVVMTAAPHDLFSDSPSRRRSRVSSFTMADHLHAHDVARTPSADLEDIDELMEQSFAIMEVISDNKVFKQRPSTSCNNSRGARLDKSKQSNSPSSSSPFRRARMDNDDGVGMAPRFATSMRHVQEHVDGQLEAYRTNEVQRADLSKRISSYNAAERVERRNSKSALRKDFVETNRTKYAAATQETIELDKARSLSRNRVYLERVLAHQEALHASRQEWCNLVRNKYDDQILMQRQREKEEAEKTMRIQQLRHDRQLKLFSMIALTSRTRLFMDKLLFGRVGRRMENSATRCARAIQKWWHGVKEQRLKEKKARMIVRVRILCRHHIKNWRDEIRGRSVRFIAKAFRIIRDTHGILLYMKRYRFRAIRIQRWWRSVRSKETQRVGILAIQWEMVEERRLRLLMKRSQQGKKMLLYIDLLKRHPEEPTFGTVLQLAAEMHTATDIPFSSNKRSAMARERTLSIVSASAQMPVTHSRDAALSVFSNASKEASAKESTRDPSVVSGGTFLTDVNDEYFMGRKKPATVYAAPDYEEVEIAKVTEHVRDSLLRHDLKIRVAQYRRLILKITHAENIIASEKKARDMLEEVRRLISEAGANRVQPLFRHRAPSDVWSDPELRRSWYHENLPHMLSEVTGTLKRAYGRVQEMLAREPMFDMTLVFPDEFRMDGYRLPRPQFTLLLPEEKVLSMIEVGEIRSKREKMLQSVHHKGR